MQSEIDRLRASVDANRVVEAENATLRERLHAMMGDMHKQSQEFAEELHKAKQSSVALRVKLEQVRRCCG